MPYSAPLKHPGSGAHSGPTRTPREKQRESRRRARLAHLPGISANSAVIPTARRGRRRSQRRRSISASCVWGGISANSPRNRNARRGSRPRVAAMLQRELRVCGANSANHAGCGRFVPAPAGRPRRPKRRGGPPRPGKPPLLLFPRQFRAPAARKPIPGARNARPAACSRRF